MPNFNHGNDEGSLLSHPLYDSPFSEIAGGPHRQTYNGFVRVNTGLYPNDETGDSARNAWHLYLQNLDITVSKHDCSTEAVAGSVVMRNGDGELIANAFIAGDYSVSATNGFTGVVSGGRF
jgi:hypothetical protein